jgi:hypothetical protein
MTIGPPPPPPLPAPPSFVVPFTPASVGFAGVLPPSSPQAALIKAHSNGNKDIRESRVALFFVPRCTVFGAFDVSESN